MMSLDSQSNASASPTHRPKWQVFWHGEWLDNFWRKPLPYWLALVSLAAATPLTFAPYYHFWLMPLLFAAFIRLLELRPTRQVRSAYLFGLIAYVCQFYWVHTALHDVSGLPNVYAIPLTFLLPAYLALFPATAIWLWEKLQLPRFIKIGIALPILWTLTEFARERLLTGFGWGALGYSQITPASPLAGFAPLGGIHLVTLMTACVGAWLVLSVNNRFIKQRLSAVVLVLCLIGGGYTAQRTDFTHAIGETTSIALAQGNIEQHLKFQEEHILSTLQRYFDQVAQTHAQIVILPETAIPLMLQDLPEGVINQFADQAQRNGSALALGIAQYTENRDGYLNAMINLSGYHPEQSHPIPYYAKNHLVPFGEYKPLPMFTEPLYLMMNMPLSDFKRGGDAQAPFHMSNQQVAFNICYEDGFGDELIASAKQATLLANASNMAWYGQSNAMYQQLQQSQARAMELGRYMARATNTGLTAIIDHKGHIVRQAPINTPFLLEGHIQGYTGETPYMKLGGSWLLISVLTLMAGALFAYNRIHLKKQLNNPSNKT